MPRHQKAPHFSKLGLFSGLTSFDDLERRIADLPDSQNKGDAFEVFAEAYLATQPVAKAKEVWPSGSIPQPVIDRLRLRSTDVGADGIIETVSGSFRGYQVKYRTGRTPLTWTETSTFFGLTDRCDERLLFTNSTDVSEIAEERKDFSTIRGTDLDRLGPGDFEAIVAWIEGREVVRERLAPRPHQEEALQKIIPAFGELDRATVISACGTGKTLVALWAAEEIAEKTVLVLVPSLALLRQTLKEWVDQTKWDNFDYLCVCSDQKISQGSDELVVRPTELEFSVTTEPSEVRRFLAHPFPGVKIVFSTYQSSPVVAEGMEGHFAFDFGIFDEAHKTAGREGTKFNFALSDSNLPIRKRLFLTATPRHFDLRCRNEEGDPEEVYSMNRPEIYGPVIHTLSFSDAAKRGIICDYKVVISVVTSEMIEDRHLSQKTVVIEGEEVRARQVANQIALAQAVERHDLKKVFTFHRTVHSAASFTCDGPEGVRTHLPKFNAYHVRGTMPTTEREGWMTEFKRVPRAVMSNARCLTEGVDVPAVDMVAFMSPRRSKVDIVQAVGRAMRKAEGKSVGYVLVPLYLEQAKGEALEAAVARAEFDEVWAVLQAMQEQDGVLDEIIHQLQAERRRTRGFDDSRFKEKVEIFGPTIQLEVLQGAITTNCLDRLARPWDEMVQMLLAYKKEHGDTRVPVEAPEPWTELGVWVDRVRSLKRRRQLTVERQTQLQGIGFSWLVDGETLGSTENLLSETEFKGTSGLTNLAKYVRRGLIEPVGLAMSGGSISRFFRREQVEELKAKLGVTLESTEGLLNETEFIKKSGLTKVADYRNQRLIAPRGFSLTNAGLSPFYHPDQIAELKKQLGVTLDSTEGLLNETEFIKVSGFSQTAKYRNQGLIVPVGYAFTQGGLSAFYHPKQVEELRTKLGLSIEQTEALMSEQEFIRASGLTKVPDYRKRGLIEPRGYAMTGSSRSTAFYHPDQIAELNAKLGITLESTDGLLNEREFKQISGLTQVDKYRKRGLITPVGFAMSRNGVAAYYHPDQIGELKARLRIALHDTANLLNERQFIEASGLTKVSEYRSRGLIEPVGYGMTAGGVGPFYHPRQISELKKKLGITLESTEGFLNEKQFMIASGLTMVASYRKKGLITPVGFAMSASAVSAYYHPSQVSELKAKLGITLESTKELLNEAEFKKACGVTRLDSYRKQGLIKPVGYAMASPRPAPYYHPDQINELRKQLGLPPKDKP